MSNDYRIMFLLKSFGDIPHFGHAHILVVPIYWGKSTGHLDFFLRKKKKRGCPADFLQKNLNWFLMYPLKGRIQSLCWQKDRLYKYDISLMWKCMFPSIQSPWLTNAPLPAPFSGLARCWRQRLAGRSAFSENRQDTMVFTINIHQITIKLHKKNMVFTY